MAGSDGTFTGFIRILRDSVGWAGGESHQGEADSAAFTKVADEPFTADY
jgi:hypothetical protein